MSGKTRDPEIWDGDTWLDVSEEFGSVDAMNLRVCRGPIPP